VIRRQDAGWALGSSRLDYRFARRAAPWFPVDQKRRDPVAGHRRARSDRLGDLGGIDP
jgi:hypothetical protein